MLAKSLARPSGLPPLNPSKPIPLDSTDPLYNAYLKQVRKKVKEKWGYPCVMDTSKRTCEYKAASLEVHFGLLEDGRVRFVEVVRKAEYPIYDEYAVNAINLASPFPPVPPDLMARAGTQSTGISIAAEFKYVVEERR